MCCFFVKNSGRLVISILKTSAQCERWSDADVINFLKSDYLRVCVFFGSRFAVDWAEVTKLFFVSETRIFASDKPRINKFFILFFTYFQYRIDESTHLLTMRDMSVLTLINEFSENGSTWSNLQITVVWSFLNIALEVGLSSWWWVSFLLIPLSILLSIWSKYSAISDPAISHLPVTHRLHNSQVDWPFYRLNRLVALFVSLIMMNLWKLSTWNLDHKTFSFKFLIELRACDD